MGLERTVRQTILQRVCATSVGLSFAADPLSRALATQTHLHAPGLARSIPRKDTRPIAIFRKPTAIFFGVSFVPPHLVTVVTVLLTVRRSSAHSAFSCASAGEACRLFITLIQLMKYDCLQCSRVFPVGRAVRASLYAIRQSSRSLFFSWGPVRSKTKR